jgi:hypothetical protein
VSDIDRDMIGFIVLVIIGIALVVTGVMYGLERPSCYRRWERSGMAVEWTPLVGCMVESSPGRWVPASSLREVTGK